MPGLDRPLSFVLPALHVLADSSAELPSRMISNLLRIPVINQVGDTVFSGALAPVPVPVLLRARTSILVYGVNLSLLFAPFPHLARISHDIPPISLHFARGRISACIGAQSINFYSSLHWQVSCSDFPPVPLAILTFISFS